MQSAKTVDFNARGAGGLQPMREILVERRSMMKAKELKLSSKQAEALREKVRTVVETNKKEAIDLCMVVYETDVRVVAVNDEYRFCWELWGYKSWEEFLGKEMDLHITTAYCLKKVWEVFYVDLQGAWNTDLLLGITKMKILAAARLDHRNVESWLKKAKGMTCRELRAKVFGTEETYSFATHLTGSQMTMVKRILDQAKTSVTKGEKMSRGDLLVHIMREWRNSNAKPLRSVA